MDDSGKAYWSATLGLLTKILIIWFWCPSVRAFCSRRCSTASCSAAIRSGSGSLQQGSIYIFIALIFWYKAAMDKIDRQFDVHEEQGPYTMDLQTTTYLVVGASFALYIGIAIWGVPAAPASSTSPAVAFTRS